MSTKELFFIAFGLVCLTAVNVFLVWPLFQGEYDKNVASIGIAHVLNARYLSRFWDKGWNPFWYGGFPNHLIYPLLAPIFLAVIQKVSLVFTMPQVYRMVVAAAYVLTPVTLFFLVRYLTGRSLIAFFSSLIYSIAPSPNYFLIPELYGDGASINFSPWQLSVISDYGEGPHIIALCLVPLAVISYWQLLRQRKFFRYVLTAFLLSIIVSINLFSAYALFYFLLGVFFSEIVLSHGKEKIKLSFLLLPLIYGFVAYCYDVSMLVSLSRSGYVHPENVFRLPPITTLILILVLGIAPLTFFLWEIFKKKPQLQKALVLAIWFVAFWGIPFAFYRGIWFGSQPNRYMPELNMTVSIIVAVCLIEFYDEFQKVLGKIGSIVSPALLIGYLAVLFYISQGFFSYGHTLVSAHPDISSSIEYRIADWLKENIDYQKGERAYLSGSPAFFLNEFADIPQLRGDEDNAQANHWWADVVYQVNKGEDGELAVGWLQAYNAKYAVVDFGATTPYKDFENQDKFRKLTESEAKIAGFEMLKIPGEKNIIQAVDLNEIDKLNPFSDPVKPVLDKQGLKAYLKAIESPAKAKITYNYAYRTNPDLATVEVSGANKSTGILFKSTFDKGWKAVWQKGDLAGKANISKIGPDLMLAKPQVDGDFRLEFSYHRPWVEYLGYLTTIATFMIIVFLIFKKRNFDL